MDEARAGIITDAAAAERESGIAQRQGIDTRDANIDRVRLHVLAIFCDPGGAAAEKLIAPGGTVAADDIDLRAGMADRGGKIGKNVEDARIVVLDVAGAVVAEEMIKPLFGLRKIKIAAAVNDVDAFAGVRMKEAEMMFLVRTINGARGTAAPRGRREKHEGQ